jgi:inorganic pyrophosphatase
MMDGDVSGGHKRGGCETLSDDVIEMARPLGVFWMEDEKGPDAKIISVLDGDPDYDHVRGLDDLPRHLLDEIEHFFNIYKDLEPGKSSSTAGFEG